MIPALFCYRRAHLKSDTPMRCQPPQNFVPTQYTKICKIDIILRAESEPKTAGGATGSIATCHTNLHGWPWQPGPENAHDSEPDSELKTKLRMLSRFLKMRTILNQFPSSKLTSENNPKLTKISQNDVRFETNFRAQN